VSDTKRKIKNIQLISNAQPVIFIAREITINIRDMPALPNKKIKQKEDNWLIMLLTG
jgi:hypothetical protein